MGGTKSTGTRKRNPALVENAVEKTIRLIIERAIKNGATDIHIEPRSGYVVIRERIDGLLQTATKLPGQALEEIVAHIKTLAKLSTKQQRAPQAGQYNFAWGRQAYEIHVATLPVINGERITLRLLGATNTALSLDKLGYWGPTLKIINHALSQPHGLVVVAGSERTGTITTLASMLGTLNNPTLNIVTIEDNPFYNVAGATQTTTKADVGMTFASRLRSVLREKPNVVMVSNVFDRRTATTAVQAATRDQLILLGLHAQDATSGLLGLSQLSDEPASIATSLHVAVGQHYTMQLCRECREPYTPTPIVQKQLVRIFGIDNLDRMRRLHELELLALEEKVGAANDQVHAEAPSTTPKRIAQLWRDRPGGCKACHGTGFNGRITINEAARPGTKLQASISRGSFSAAELRKAAMAHGMIPMALDALVKSLRGIVPIEVTLACAKN